MTSPHLKALTASLDWYLDNGVDEALLDSANDRRKKLSEQPFEAFRQDISATKPHALQDNKQIKPVSKPAIASTAKQALGKTDARAQAIKLAKQANSLEDLREAIAAFDGLSVKKTATNLVFSDGHPEAPIMVIGEAPAADEDRQGKPFMGVSGQLLDKIFNQIGLSRDAEETKNALYLSNILNWRPPGNRTPNDTEIAVSLPFIEKHIMLAQPKILIFCGSLAAQALLGRSESISRLRGDWHAYSPKTTELGYSGPEIPALATYHPDYLLRTPAQKKAVWSDVLRVMHKLKDI